MAGDSDTGQNSTHHAFFYDGVIHDLGTLGGANSYGRGMNSSGQIAGYSDITGNNGQHAFLYDGTMHDLGTLGGSFSTGRAINASQEVTGGSYTTGNAAFHAFLYDGTMHDLGTLGITSEGFAINDGGQVAGQFLLSNGNPHAFLYDGVMHDLGTLGGTQSDAFGINDNGRVVGSTLMPANAARHAFLYDGAMHDLGTLGGQNSAAFAINSKGQVTGYASDKAGFSDAFLYDPTRGMLNLNSLISPSSGWFLSEGDAINDTGQITGIGTHGFVTHAFLLTPVPEPNTAVLASFGGLLFLLSRKLKPIRKRPA